MNLDEVFGLDETMPMVATDPFLLLGCILTAVLAAWFCVWKYRKTFEIEKSIRMYLPFALGGTVVFAIAGVPVLFAVGAQLCGFVALMLISNHYFKK
ncbi:MAG: hypothetical protein IJZ39_00690 [Oscillospiraceae bacterium]|nr:hypothetical protein [Oscillospiraceae bacterium]